MSKENNKMQVDIDTLKKQNVNDLSAIKELYRKLKEIQEKISQIKYIDSTLANKLKKEYENLKKIILDENIQLELSGKIEETKALLQNNVEEINLQMNDMVIYNNDYLNVKKYMEKYNKTLVDIINQGFKKLYFEKDGNYNITERVTLSEVYIVGDNATIILEHKTTLTQEIIMLDNIHQLEGVNFISKDTEINPLVRIKNSNNLVIKNISVTQSPVTNKTANCTSVDVFTNNKNLTFINCTFNQFNRSHEGGVWVREATKGVVTSNITFKDCFFNQKGSDDELIAIWGWQGEIRDVVVENCKFTLEPTENFCSQYVITLGQSGKGNNFIFRNNVIECGELRHGVFRTNEVESDSNSINRNIIIENNTVNIYSSNPNYNRRIVGITKSNSDNYSSNEITVEFNKNIINCYCSTNRPFTGIAKFENNIINISETSILFTNCDKIINNTIHIDNLKSSIFEQCKYIANNNIFLLSIGTYYLYYSKVDLKEKGLTSMTIINNNFNISPTCNLQLLTLFIDVLFDKNYISGNMNLFQCRDNTNFVVTNNNFKTGIAPSSNSTVKLFKNNIIDNTLVDDKLIVT